MDLNLGDTRAIIKECLRQGLGTRQAAYVLATSYWETARTMKPVREAFWLSEDWRRAKLRYYPWYGRGYVQLTWKENYQKAGAQLGLDLTTDPDAAMEPVAATKVLVTGMMKGWFTGKSLPQYVNEGRRDYINARRVVNGTDRAEEIAALARDYETALDADDYGVGRPFDLTGGPIAAIAAVIAAAVAAIAKWLGAF